MKVMFSQWGIEWTLSVTLNVAGVHIKQLTMIYRIQFNVLFLFSTNTTTVLFYNHFCASFPAPILAKHQTTNNSIFMAPVIYELGM